MSILSEYEESLLTDQDRMSFAFLSSRFQVSCGKASASGFVGKCDAAILLGNVDVEGVFLDSHTNEPVVFSVVDSEIDPSNPSLSKRSDAADIIVFSTERCRTSTNPFEPNAAILSVIPKGVDPERCLAIDRDVARRMFNLPDKSIIGYIGRVEPNANLETLIEAVGFLPERFALLICGYGEGDYLEFLQALVDDKVPGRVGFLPWNYELGGYLSCIDALVKPSSRGGFGSAIVEAWASHTPVISVDVGIASVNKRLVRIMPRTNRGEIVARCILNDFADPNRTARVDAAAKTAAMEYTIGKTGGEWSELIRTAVESRRSARPADGKVAPPVRSPRAAYVAKKAVDACRWRGLLPECSCRNKFSCALGKGGVKPGVVTIEECIECKIEGASQNDFVTPEGFPSQAEVSIVVEGWDADAREFAENVRDHWISDDLSFGSVHYKTGDSFSTFGIDATAKSFSSFSDVMIYYGTSPSQALIDSQPSHVVNIKVVDNPLTAKEEVESAFWADLIVATSRDAADRIGNSRVVAIIHDGVTVPEGDCIDWGFPEGSVVVSTCGIASAVALAEAMETGDERIAGVMAGIGSIHSESIRNFQNKLGDRVKIIQEGDIGQIIASTDVFLNVDMDRGFGRSVAKAWLSSVPVVATSGGVVDPASDLAVIVPNTWTSEDVSAKIMIATEETQGNRLRLLRARKYVCDQMTPQRCARRWAETIGRLIQSGRAPQSS
jgi:glycosyltransferase involved in cell wall biosynthesis